MSAAEKPGWLTLAPPADADPDFARWSELYTLFRGANADEQRVILRIARQVASKGRREYGALNIAADKRNHSKEALAEVADALFYVAVALEREP